MNSVVKTLIKIGGGCIIAGTGGWVIWQENSKKPRKKSNKAPIKPDIKKADENDEIRKSKYDEDGYDKDGFDRKGYDSEGYNKYGYDRDGFNRDGFNKSGYNKDLYNVYGVDISNNCSEYYKEKFKKIEKRLVDAKTQLDKGKKRYALSDIKLVLDETSRLVIIHAKGKLYIKDKLSDNLNECEKLIKNRECIVEWKKLHDGRKICNGSAHEIDYEESLTYDKVYFALMQAKDFVDAAKDYIL